jgi:hypothetical protein
MSPVLLSKKSVERLLFQMLFSMRVSQNTVVLNLQISDCISLAYPIIVELEIWNYSSA